jgi:uncharacterized protein DUF6527
MQKLTEIKLLRVHYVPKTLEPGILYVSEEFGAALHLCACGCGLKVSTPIGPTDWTFEETLAGATLFPSVGNWQQPCKSHYFIRDGSVIWLDAWTPQQITAGRRAKERRDEAYFEARAPQRGSLLPRFWRWIKSLFNSRH